jgi:uncharacterized membrane protein
MQVRSAARIAAMVLAAVAYVAGSHWLMTQTQASAWNVVGVLMPMLLVVAAGAWRSGHRFVSALSLLVIAVLSGLAIAGVKISGNGLYLAQHVGINFFLAIVFGSTLRAGHTPLITALALRVHRGRLAPGQAEYTRHLTQAWVMLFVGIVAISLALFFFASFEAWAVFANLLTPVAVALMFGGELMIRYRLHPQFERSTAADAIRAYMQNSRAPAQSAQGNSAP